MDKYCRCRSSLSPEQVSDFLSRLKHFNVNGNKIRTVDCNGQRWIVFADICKILGYKNANNEHKRLCPAEKCRLEIGLKNTLAVCVNESGLRSFVMFSNKMSALEFYNWAETEIFENKSAPSDAANT